MKKASKFVASLLAGSMVMSMANPYARITALSFS